MPSPIENKQNDILTKCIIEPFNKRAQKRIISKDQCRTTLGEYKPDLQKKLLAA